MLIITALPSERMEEVGERDVFALSSFSRCDTLPSERETGSGRSNDCVTLFISQRPVRHYCLME